jgi:hypothetical protein
VVSGDGMCHSWTFETGIPCHRGIARIGWLLSRCNVIFLRGLVKCLRGIFSAAAADTVEGGEGCCWEKKAHSCCKGTREELVCLSWRLVKNVGRDSSMEHIKAHSSMEDCKANMGGEDPCNGSGYGLLAVAWSMYCKHLEAKGPARFSLWTKKIMKEKHLEVKGPASFSQ